MPPITSVISIIGIIANIKANTSIKPNAVASSPFAPDIQQQKKLINKENINTGYDKNLIFNFLKSKTQ